MENDLPARLLAEAQRHTPTLEERSRLMPFREAILTFRAKRTSYERIAAALKAHGIAIHPATVGYFCRRYCTKADIQRTRLQLVTSTIGAPGFSGSLMSALPAPIPARRRGPRIARDDL